MTYLYLLVFISGGAVLALEIVGTRVLGPFYGVSLFLWSALITVTLAALSVGYVVGGRWADRGPTLPRLAAVLASAGFWTLCIPLLKRPVLLAAEPFGLRPAVLVAAFLLFAPPLTLLGMVSPYAIRLRASSLGAVGRTAGDLFAVSTIGSVLAALLTGFVLIPNVGVNRLLQCIGFALVLTAAAGLVADRGRRSLALAGTLTLGALAMSAFTGSGAVAAPSAGLLAVRESPYAEIRVLEARGRRHLVIDGGVHTIVTPGSWESQFPYVAVAGLTRRFFEAPGRMLLIGLGGGSVVKDFAAHGWEVTAVEIDPAVIETAYEYFGLDLSDGRVHLDDGRRFLIEHDTRYDIVIMDAFGSSSIPFHLVTEEAFRLVADRLTPEGVIALNIEAPSWESRIARSFAATLQTTFSDVFVLPAHRSPNDLGNLLFLGGKGDLTLMKPLERDLAPRDEQHRIFAWDHRISLSTADVPVLTDDLNPVDLWSEEINLRARRNLHEYFAEGFSW